MKTIALRFVAVFLILVASVAAGPSTNDQAAKLQQKLTELARLRSDLQQVRSDLVAEGGRYRRRKAELQERSASIQVAEKEAKQRFSELKSQSESIESQLSQFSQANQALFEKLLLELQVIEKLIETGIPHRKAERLSAIKSFKSALETPSYRSDLASHFQWLQSELQLTQSSETWNGPVFLSNKEIKVEADQFRLGLLVHGYVAENKSQASMSYGSGQKIEYLLDSGPNSINVKNSLEELSGLIEALAGRKNPELSRLALPAAKTNQSKAGQDK